MKKILISLICCSASLSYAYTNADLNSGKYKCSNLLINNQTTESQIRTKCKNTSEKISEYVKDGHNSNHVSGAGSDQIQNDDENVTDNQYDAWTFTNDANQKMKCYFKNSKLLKCKVSN